MRSSPGHPPARSRDEFLALADDVLVPYVSAWLIARGLAEDGDTLSQPEHDVMLTSLAFAAMAAGGTSALAGDHKDDVPAMREGLRQMGLYRFADVLADLLALPPGADRAPLDARWRAISDDPTPRIAAYLRIHAGEIAWQRMR